jgi:hypothetical protein
MNVPDSRSPEHFMFFLTLWSSAPRVEFHRISACLKPLSIHKSSYPSVWSSQSELHACCSHFGTLSRQGTTSDDRRWQRLQVHATPRPAIGDHRRDTDLKIVLHTYEPTVKHTMVRFTAYDFITSCRLSWPWCAASRAASSSHSTGCTLQGTHSGTAWFVCAQRWVCTCARVLLALPHPVFVLGRRWQLKRLSIDVVQLNTGLVIRKRGNCIILRRRTHRSPFNP